MSKTSTASNADANNEAANAGDVAGQFEQKVKEAHQSISSNVTITHRYEQPSTMETVKKATVEAVIGTSVLLGGIALMRYFGRGVTVTA